MDTYQEIVIPGRQDYVYYLQGMDDPDVVKIYLSTSEPDFAETDGMFPDWRTYQRSALLARKPDVIPDERVIYARATRGTDVSAGMVLRSERMRESQISKTFLEVTRRTVAISGELCSSTSRIYAGETLQRLIGECSSLKVRLITEFEHKLHLSTVTAKLNG